MSFRNIKTPSGNGNEFQFCAELQLIYFMCHKIYVDMYETKIPRVYRNITTLPLHEQKKYLLYRAISLSLTKQIITRTQKWIKEPTIISITLFDKKIFFEPELIIFSKFWMLNTNPFFKLFYYITLQFKLQKKILFNIIVYIDNI